MKKLIIKSELTKRTKIEQVLRHGTSENFKEICKNKGQLLKSENYKKYGENVLNEIFYINKMIATIVSEQSVKSGKWYIMEYGLSTKNHHELENEYEIVKEKEAKK